jgi:broad specificity phosphatase PhoE
MKTCFAALVFVAILTTFSCVAYAQQAVFLVRHADLVGQAMAPPKDLPLSEAGQARAEKLASLLKDAGVTAIYTTEFLRTRKTAEPLAQTLKIEIKEVEKGAPEPLVERLRKEHREDRVLIVGHSDTLPGLLKALGHPGEIVIAPQDFSNLFVLVPKSDGPPMLLYLRY